MQGNLIWPNALKTGAIIKHIKLAANIKSIHPVQLITCAVFQASKNRTRFLNNSFIYIYITLHIKTENSSQGSSLGALQTFHVSARRLDFVKVKASLLAETLATH